MTKILKFDFFFSFSLLSIVFFYILFQLLDVELFSTLFRYGFVPVVTFIFFIVFFKDRLTVRKILFFAPLIAFELIYLTKLIQQANFGAIVSVTMQACFFMLVFIASSVKWEKYQLRVLSTLSMFVFALVLIQTFGVYQTGQYNINPNSLGAYAFFLMFFPMIRVLESGKKLKTTRLILLLTITLLAVYFSVSRSILLCILAAFITFFLWKIISSNKLFFNLFFLVVILLIFFVTALYPKIHLWDGFYTLERLSLEYTGKSLLTGRGYLWEAMLDAISLKPILGHGAGAGIEDFINTTLSPHNLYLQIGLQVGIFGIVLFIWFLTSVWKTFWKYRADIKVRLSASFFVAILVHQVFEISLLNINFGIGALQWLIIGFAINFAIKPGYKTTSD